MILPELEGRHLDPRPRSAPAARELPRGGSKELLGSLSTGFLRVCPRGAVRAPISSTIDWSSGSEKVFYSGLLRNFPDNPPARVIQDSKIRK